MTAPLFAIVAGAGSGTGASTALRFAKSYPVVLLARQAKSVDPIVRDVQAAGGSAFGYSADTADPDSLDAAFAQIAKDLPGAKCAVAVYNANAGFAIKPFLEMAPADLTTSLGAAAHGLFNFAQKTIPSLLEAVEVSKYPPTLIVTGATASLRGSARMSTFAAGKFAQRALTQSLAREFGPIGVHVALAIIDGGIDTPWGKGMVMNGGVADGKISPDAIAENYWQLHVQHRSAFTHELDIRPFVEKF